MQIWKNLTRVLGAGADPAIVRRAVDEDSEDILHIIAGNDMVFTSDQERGLRLAVKTRSGL